MLPGLLNSNKFFKRKIKLKIIKKIKSVFACACACDSNKR